MDAVAAAVGVKLGRRSPVEAALVESLTGREALIVLDNCEHMVAASARLAEALLRGCPGLQVLATSREPLQVPGEIVWRVPSALDWSYRLLEDDEATLLRRLPVFAGSFGLDAAEAVCAGEGLPALEVVDVLMRLVGKSLVVAEEADGQPRYRLLEMVRQYARERLAETAEQDPMFERHARWYLELPGRLDQGELAADGAGVRLRRLDLETDNLRAALSWLLDHAPPEALRLAGSLTDWWLLRGRLGEGREWLEAVLERTPPESAGAAAALCSRCRSPAAAATWCAGPGWPSAACRSTACSATGREPRGRRAGGRPRDRRRRHRGRPPQGGRRGPVPHAAPPS